MLRPFHRRLRSEIERVGGTLDKLIGDAVMAVFGVPAVHEDDPERAVRCALRMLDAIADLNQAHPALGLAVRIGVNTGEALVALERGADSEGVVGDVVNTAARLQGVAPVNGVVVGEATWRATRTLFAYEQLDPVPVKGKAEPVPIFRVLGGPQSPGGGCGGATCDAADRPRRGAGSAATLLPGSVRRACGAAGHRARRTWGREEPAGAGVRRLRRRPAGTGRLAPGPLSGLWPGRRLLGVGRDHQGPSWRHGVRRPLAVAAKLDATVGAVTGDASEREWLKARLAPLVGLATLAEAPAGRDESFVAWRRFLHLVARQSPLVLVIEDLHWADPALLDFLEQLFDHPDAADLMVVVTARPALLDRRPGWGAGRPNARTVSLAPLDDQQTAALLEALIGQSALPAGVQSMLLERAGGNPLYAEEFVRLLSDRGLLTPHGNLAQVSDLPVPESVQAVIAARLDTLAPEHKTLLQAAAVFGKVFWSGALVAMEGVSEEEEVRRGLAQLERKELIRAARLSAVEDEAEYSFWHVLIRDVAYAQIPRIGRARRHRAAAEWIQDLAGDRVADRAELIAFHFAQALVHARAAMEPDLAELEGWTREALVLAGDSMLGLNLARAEAHYRQALELCPPGAPGRARVAARVGRAAFQAGRVAEATWIYEEAVTGFAAEGDVVGQGEALNRLSSVLWNQGEARRARDALVRAVELLEPVGPGPELCSAYAQMAMDRVMSGHPQEALGWADKALALADELGGLPEERLWALDARGVARGDLGDLGGMEDLRAALAVGREIGAGYDTAVVYINLIEALWLSEGPAAALETCQEAIEFSERRGLVEGAAWIRSATLEPLLDLGRWDEAVETADTVVGWEQGHGQYLSQTAHQVKARVLLWRGEVEAARALTRKLLPRARSIEDLQLLVPALATAAAVEQAAGDHMAVRALVEEVLRVVGERGGGGWYLGQQIADLVRVCVAVGQRAAGKALAAQAHDGVARNRHGPLAARAALAEADGALDEAARRYEEAAARWGDFGQQLERARALLGAGRCLVAVGRPEGRDRLQSAGRLLATLNAGPLLAEANAALRRSTTARHARRR